MNILVATKNRGKYREIRKLLKKISPKSKITSLLDLESPPKIVENGKTFKENALKKALALTKFSNSIVIADDSGLEVKYLDNKPGIKSSRFSGKNANDKRNNQKLLKLLKGLKRKDRKAKFVCSAIAYFPQTKMVKHARGTVCGYIIDKEIGSDGFGYDPLFYYPPLKKTFAQIPLAKKNKFSHRYNAFQKLTAKIKPLLK